MDVEALAVAKIQGMVGRCPHLKPFIASNDKTPFTDGHIDVYNGAGQKKTDWIGRVTVQVKGRTRSGKQPLDPTFSISRTDLLAFQRDSGVLYIYVAVSKEGRCAPYYALLSPFTIEHYLGQIPVDQKTISVSFKKLGNDPREIERIVGVALKTKNQSLSLGFEPALFEQMKSLTLYSAADLNLDEPIVLTPGEVDYALEMTTEGGMSVQLGGVLHIIPQQYTEQTLDVRIGAGGVTFEQATVRRIDALTVEVRLGECLTLVMRDTDQKRMWNVSFVAQSNFAARLKAAEFLIGLVESGAIEINGEVTPLGQRALDMRREIGQFRGHLASLSQLRELFERLGVDGSLVDLDELESEQIINLQALHRSFVGGEEIHNDNGEVTRSVLNVGRWALMILTVPGSKPNTWRYVDPFDPEAPHMFRWSADGDDENSGFPVTAYDTIEEEYLPILLNLHLDSILDAYEAIADQEPTMGLANQRVLALILAADASELRRNEFLRAADLVNEWVIRHVGEKTAHLINKWQILWRRNELTPADRKSIRALKSQMSRRLDPMSEEAELACALLLGDDDEADYLIGQMAATKLGAVQSWPIWKLKRGEDA
ncbi:hypothetical protein [Agromyces sp. Leaf222]|uniref:hypothetical protein n=1 Tax=Agromyces sp. Leaf222 TaxID=1735688 RepID=UPI0012FA0931|nr:hypothetical protein [Agromyces sp. Leaf222]